MLLPSSRAVVTRPATASARVFDTLTSQALFQPITIGRHVRLPNRFVMQPMYMNMESELGLWSRDHMDALATFYAERAHYGAKLIVMGGLSPSRMGRWRKGVLMLAKRDEAHALRRITDAVHREEGYILAQAFHAGRSARKQFAVSATSTPSAVPAAASTRTLRLPACCVDYVVSEYNRFARLAEEAGFDGVEVPVSEGTLLHNFLSSAINDRDDRFGGSLTNRLDFVIRVLERLKSSLRRPDQFIVSLRLCLHDLQVNGTPMEDTLLVAEMLAGSGYVDMLNTSVGMHDSPVQTLASYVPQGTFARSCQLVRRRLQERQISIPVVASHRIHSVAVAQRLMARQTCDLVGIARPLLADAQFIAKAATQHEEFILPCIGCNHCVNRLYKHQRVTCALNPIAGYELERGWTPTRHRKSIAVIGAGPAGVTCALTLWRRGHDVTLFEKEPYVGGQLNYAKLIPGKEGYQDLLEYWTRELRASTINVRLGHEFVREDMTGNHQFFHAVVLATGGLPRPVTSNGLPGATEFGLVVPFHAILDGSVTAGRRVFILGNGAIAHDVASFLLHDHRVARGVEFYLDEWGVDLQKGTLSPTAHERAPRNGRDVIVMESFAHDADLSRGKGWTQKRWLRQHGGTVLDKGIPVQVSSEGITVNMFVPERRSYFVPCDTIVWCRGMLPNIRVGTWIYEWMRDGAKRRGEVIEDFGIYAAGMCRDSSTGDGNGEQDLLQAIHEGYEIGYKV